MAEFLQPPNSRHVNAGASSRLRARLRDFDDEVLPKSAITGLMLTIKDEAGNVINSRNEQPILDMNNGSLAEDGWVTIKLQPADNALQSTTEKVEWHYVQLVWTWRDDDLDEQRGEHDWQIQIRELV